MFYWLTELSDKLTFLNVFRYITFRTGGAVVTALVFVFLFGGPMIEALRARQGKGQPIRIDGPQSHIIAKKGTPTMGGLMILSGMLVSTLLWANPANPYVWIVLGVTLSFGLIGFYDDYLKVTKQQSNTGFAGRTRLIAEAVIAIAAVTGSTETLVVLAGGLLLLAAFLLVQLATMLILYTGANTPFNGFPFLANFVASDGYLPRWLTKRGHRLAFSNGIVVLAVVSIGLVVATGGHVNNLVAFYAIGVFTGFTLAGFGMARYFRSHGGPQWRAKGGAPGGGANCTGRSAGDLKLNAAGWRRRGDQWCRERGGCRGRRGRG